MCFFRNQIVKGECIMNKGKKAVSIIGVILAIFIVLAAVGGCVYLYKEHGTLQNQYNELKADKDQIVKEEVLAELDNVKNQERDAVLEEFKEGFDLNGNTISFLREMYKDKYLVYQLSGSYMFEDILDLEMADYSKGEFVTDEATGLRSFQVDGKNVTEAVIDVSKYQGVIDWTAVKNFGIDGAIIRAGVRGYGSGEIVADTEFDTNMKNAIKAGLKTGAYFFTEAITEEEAIEEAEFVIEALEPYKIKLPVVLDLEMIDGDEARNEKVSKEELTKVALAFLQTVEEAGYEPMIYGNIRSISDMVDMEQLKNYKLWFAYYNDDIYIPYKVFMWQYASDGRVDGISTDCDVNMMFME